MAGLSNHTTGLLAQFMKSWHASPSQLIIPLPIYQIKDLIDIVRIGELRGHVNTFKMHLKAALDENCEPGRIL